MLVLSRRIGDDIVLPELGVRIRLLKTKGNSASVGVDAPRDITVLRGELTPFETSEPQEPVIASLQAAAG